MFNKVVSLVVLVLSLCLPAQIRASGVYFARTNYSVGSQPAGVCLANLRGKIGGTQVFRDLATANYAASTVSVRLCLDDGTFGARTDYPVGPNPSAILYGDFNNDGWGDLVTANSGTNTVSVLRNLGVGANFAPAEDFVVGATADPGPSGVTSVDLDKDGKDDIIVANYNESTISVLYNLGGATFSGSSEYDVGAGPSFIFSKDINGDGWPDILTANKDDGSVSILMGDTFGFLDEATSITLYPGGDPQPVCIAAADFNGDGIQDIVTADYNSNTVTILFGFVTNGDWSVQSQTSLDTGTHPKSLCVRDFNADGIPDIAVANEGDGTVTIFLGTGLGSFQNAGTYAVGFTPSGLAGSNFNGDRSTDLAAANAGDNTVSILLFSGPVAYNSPASANEDTPKSITMSGSLLSGAPMLYQIVTPPVNGMLSSSNGQTLTYTPTNDYFGPDSFSFETVDTNSSLTSAVATVSITVQPVNDAPSFTLATNTFTVIEDSALTNFPGIVTNLSAGPANETGQTMGFVFTYTNNSFFAVKPTISPDGTLFFRVARNVTGTNVVQARVKDSGGTLRGGINLSAPQPITIVVQPLPLKPHRGIYTGLFIATNGVVAQPDSGFFTFSMAEYGQFAGYVRGNGGRHTFSGTFDVTGHALVAVPLPTNSLTLDLQLDLTNGTDQVIGLLTNSAGVYSDVIGDRSVFQTATNPCPLAGGYTLVIPGNGNPTNGPGGDSYATLSINSNGLISAAGKLSDNTAFSQSVHVSKYGNWPFYVSLLSGKGEVLGWLAFTNLPDHSIEGDVSWIRPATTMKYYPAGFTNLTAAVGSTYISPPGGVRIVATTNNLVIYSGGNISGSVTNASTLTTGSAVIVDTMTILSVANFGNGRMTGTFLHPVLGVNKALNAVPLQQQNSIRGFFLGLNLSGKFDLEPND